MYTFMLLVIMACASAAPRHRHYHNHMSYPNFSDMSLERYMERDVFDTRRFWEELNREMVGIEAMLADLSKRFSNSISNAKYEDNQYKITMSLPNFEENDIVVKARKGLLIIQAVHREEGVPDRSYLDVRTLPQRVNEKGNWTFENGELTIVFPLFQKVDKAKENSTELPIIRAIDHSREAIDDNPTNDDNINADVGVNRQDINNRTELLTNEIPQNKVEATTYRVDLQGDVELLPVFL